MFPSLLRSIIALVTLETLLRTFARRAHMSSVVIRLIVIDEQRTVLVITLRLLFGNLDDVKSALEAVAILENLVHLLQRPVGCLGVEEVDTRYHEGVDDGKNDVGLVADICEGWRCDHDHEELGKMLVIKDTRCRKITWLLCTYIENPIRRRRDRIGRRTNGQGRDFGRVQPRHAQPADRKERVEDKQEDGSRDTGALADIRVLAGGGEDDHGQ